MAKKRISIRVDDDTLSRIKIGAVQGGRSLSDFAFATLRRGLDAEGSGKADTGPGIGEILASGLDDVKAGIRGLGRALSETRTTGAGATAGYPWTFEQVRFLIYTLARLDKFFTVYNAAWGQNDANVGTRARVASEAGDRAVQKFGLKEDDHAR